MGVDLRGEKEEGGFGEILGGKGKRNSLFIELDCFFGKLWLNSKSHRTFFERSKPKKIPKSFYQSRSNLCIFCFPFL